MLFDTYMKSLMMLDEGVESLLGSGGCCVFTDLHIVQNLGAYTTCFRYDLTLPSATRFLGSSFSFARPQILYNLCLYENADPFMLVEEAKPSYVKVSSTLETMRPAYPTPLPNQKDITNLSNSPHSTS